MGNERVVEMPAPRLTVIRPRSGWLRLDLAEIAEFRELLWVLAAREVKVRYRQTVLGGLWAVLQPVAVMLVFSIFFGKLAGLDQRTGGVPYSLFAFAALVPWMYFSHALASASMSVVDHRGLITKVYFPRLLLPMAPLLSGLVDFLLSLAVLIGMILFRGISPTPAWLLLPAFTLLAMAAALGIGLWLSALNAHYRDFRYVIPFLLQVWLFITPIAYPGSIVPEEWRMLYGLNPMVGVVEGFRWCLLGTGPAPGPLLGASALATVLLLVAGLAFFRRMERSFVDVV